MVKNQTLDQPGALGGWLGALDGDLERLDDPAVLNPGGTRRFAGAAVEAEVKVVANLSAEPDSTIRHGSHQVDSSARAVVLVGGLDVRGTTRRAKPAMDTIL